MPERSIHKIMTATEPADVAQLAVIECLRSIADSNQKTAAVLEGVQTEVRDVRERLIRIEAPEGNAVDYDYDARGNVVKPLTLTAFPRKRLGLSAVSSSGPFRDGPLSSGRLSRPARARARSAGNGPSPESTMMSPAMRFL
mgnify:CR=1 FL=1